jgi:hypothetical protein
MWSRLRTPRTPEQPDNAATRRSPGAQTGSAAEAETPGTTAEEALAVMNSHYDAWTTFLEKKHRLVQGFREKSKEDGVHQRFLSWKAQLPEWASQEFRVDAHFEKVQAVVSRLLPLRRVPPVAKFSVRPVGASRRWFVWRRVRFRCFYWWQQDPVQFPEEFAEMNFSESLWCKIFAV